MDDIQFRLLTYGERRLYSKGFRFGFWFGIAICGTVVSLALLLWGR